MRKKKKSPSIIPAIVIVFAVTFGIFAAVAVIRSSIKNQKEWSGRPDIEDILWQNSAAESWRAAEHGQEMHFRGWCLAIYPDECHCFYNTKHGLVSFAIKREKWNRYDIAIEAIVKIERGSKQYETKITIVRWREITTNLPPKPNLR